LIPFEYKPDMSSETSNEESNIRIRAHLPELTATVTNEFTSLIRTDQVQNLLTLQTEM